MSSELSVSHIWTSSVIYHWIGARQQVIYLFLIYQGLGIICRKRRCKIAIKGSETNLLQQRGIPFHVRVLEKITHHVYLKQHFTCHEFKPWRLQISLHVCKVSGKSWIDQFVVSKTLVLSDRLTVSFLMFIRLLCIFRERLLLNLKVATNGLCFPSVFIEKSIFTFR